MSEARLTHELRRVHADGTEERVSQHPTFTEGWSAGTAAVHADRENAYALYRGRTRVAVFCPARGRSRASQA